jgi:hypothetical protein
MAISDIHLAKLKRDRLLELQLLRMRANQAVSQMTNNVSELLDERDIQFKETVAGWDRLNQLNEENKRLREWTNETPRHRLAFRKIARVAAMADRC